MPAGQLIDLRRRVRSVKNIQQITRAMKFISASRLRKAQDRIFSARPYANRMLAVLNSLATRVDPSSHPLLVRREEERVMLVVITSDKGLCGSFNSNIIKGAVAHIQEEGVNKELSLALVGLATPGVVIRDPGCTAKTYPEFFRDLASLSGRG